MDPPPTTVLLPTVRWTDACDEVATQLRASDELLVICDTATDPVAARRAESDALPDGVRILLAGEPTGCSGKANAIATGMEAAENERIVWTDDDFHHPPDWLATLQADYERQGPTTERPMFIGLDPLARLFEPAYAIGGTGAVAAGEIVWGGAVIFERADLQIPADFGSHTRGTEADATSIPGDADATSIPGDRSTASLGTDSSTNPEAAFLRDLRRTISDDGTLSAYLSVTPADRTRSVSAGGSPRESLERFVRFFWIVRFHAPRAAAASIALALGCVIVCLLAPVIGVTLITGIGGAVYARFGIRRATFLLTAPSALVAPLVIAYAVTRRTFVWGGRRYRWRSLFDVTIVDA